MNEAYEAVVKTAAALTGIGVLCLIHRQGAQAVNRRRLILRLAVALGALGYVNYGGFHTDGTPLHIWDQFHYVIGSKYFPELGYDGIYAALLAARHEATPSRPLPSRARDLRTGRIVSTASLSGFMLEVRERFSDSRWSAFRADALSFQLRDEILLDHGYNPTPARTAIERLFTAHLPFRTRTAALFAIPDFLLLAAAGAVIRRVFGLEALAAVALVFGLGFCSRYYWVGGAFLRQDWLVALIFAAAALALRRPRLAGAALAYAACTRVFPILMLLPLALFGLSAWRRDRSFDSTRFFAEGFVAVAVGLLVAGCLAGRGPTAWLESAERLRVHSSAVGPNAIGLRVILSTSMTNLRGDLVDPTTFYDYERIADDVAQTGRDNLMLISLATAVLLGLSAVVASTTRDPVVALAAGVGVIYAVATPSAYYGSFFTLLALVQPIRTAVVFLTASVLMYGGAGLVLLLSRAGTIRLNGAAVYTPVSVMLLLVLVWWLYDMRGKRSGLPIPPERPS